MMKNSQKSISKIWIVAIGFAVFLAVCASSALAQSNTFPSSGNVGIGTTNPGRMLDIKGVASGAEPIINLNRGLNTDNAALILQTAATSDWILGERGIN